MDSNNLFWIDEAAFKEPVLVPSDHPILRTVLPKYEGDCSKVRNLAFRMWQIMIKSGGIGMAANQIGNYTRMFVMTPELGNFSFRDGLIAINPEWKSVEGSVDVEAEEGCLSFGKKIIKCKRPNIIMARWTDLKGQQRMEQFSGIVARAFIHETEHLDGKSIFFEGAI